MPPEYRQRKPPLPEGCLARKSSAAAPPDQTAQRRCLICYTFYSGVDWEGIHTCMLTCVIVANPNVGSSYQKMALRFGGAGETGVCAGAETTQMVESGVAGAGLAVRGECVADFLVQVCPDGKIFQLPFL